MTDNQTKIYSKFIHPEYKKCVLISPMTETKKPKYNLSEEQREKLEKYLKTTRNLVHLEAWSFSKRKNDPIIITLFYNPKISDDDIEKENRQIIQKICNISERSNNNNA